MFNIQTVVDVSNFISNKEQTGKTITTPEINTIIDEINIEAFNILYRDYESKQRNKDSLSPFIKVMGENQAPPLKINEYGVAITPTDYAHIIPGGLYYTWLENGEDTFTKDKCGRVKAGNKKESKQREVKVRILRDSQVSAVLSDANKKPTLENPYCVIRDEYIQFYPFNLNSIKFTYFRYPVNPIYVTIMDMQTLTESYDSVNSINFEYKDEDYPLLIALFCIHLGSNLSRKDLIEMAQLKLQAL